MSSEHTQERRQFVKHFAVTAAAVTAVGAARTVAAEPQQLAKATDVQKPGKATPTPAAKTLMLDRSAMAKLSNKLYTSPGERQKFLTNPETYATEILGGKVQDTRKLQQMKEMISDGFCCGGCGC